MTAILRGYKINIEKYVSSTDGNLLDFLGVDKASREDYATALLSNFQFKSKDSEKLLSQSIVNNDDPTPFKDIGQIIPLLDDDMSSLFSKIDSIGLVEAERNDLLSFLVILKTLLYSDGESIKISDQITHILSNLSIASNNENSFSSIIHVLDVIKSDVLTDLADINELLTKGIGTPKAKSLTAFMIFVKAPYSGDFTKLLTSLDNFPITIYEKRLVWMYFGAWHGMSAFGKAFKESPHINRIADELTTRYCKNDLMINRIPKYTNFIKYRSVDGVKCITLEGYVLDLYVQITREDKEIQRVRDILIDALQNGSIVKSKKISSTLLKNYKKFGEELTFVVSVERTTDTLLVESDKKYVIRNVKKGVRMEIDLDVLFENVILVEEVFRDSYRRNKAVWLDIERQLRGIF